MQSFLNIVKSNIVAQAIISIVVGLLLMFWPGITIVTVLYLVGIVFAVMGISSLVSYFRAPEAERQVGVVATGVFFCLVALIVFLFPQVIAGFFSVVLGIILVICGAVNAVRSGELKKYGGTLVGVLHGVERAHHHRRPRYHREPVRDHVAVRVHPRSYHCCEWHRGLDRRCRTAQSHQESIR